jgi:signal transduction histidine kinase
MEKTPHAMTVGSPPGIGLTSSVSQGQQNDNQTNSEDSTLALPELASPDIMAFLCWIGSGSRLSRLIAGFFSILVIGVLNYYTSPQISSSLFYLLPILFLTHFSGRRAGIAAALIATSLWLVADTTGSTIYSNAWIPFCNAVMRLGVFLIVVWLLSLMRILMDSLEQRVEQRTNQLRQESSERRNLEKRILEISEREQARMGQDLHDGLCQHLVGTAFSVNLLQQKLEDSGRPEVKDAAKIASLLDESITQARQLARGLYPVRIEDLGLATALEELSERMQDMFHIACEFSSQGDALKLDQLVSVHLYRIAQEAVTNAVKHARPGGIWILLKFFPDEVALRVEDDGIGIKNDSSRSGGLGVKIMEFRARMIGADFQIDARRGGGTVVNCVYPVSNVIL